MRLIENCVLFDCLILAACGLRVTLGQDPPSPCPDVFSYQKDGDDWYGIITGRSSSYGDVIETSIYMIYDGILKNGNVGNIDRVSTNDELASVIDRGGAIRYRVLLGTRPLPWLKRIKFNGRVVCESERDDIWLNDVTKIERAHSLNPRPTHTANQKDSTAVQKPYREPVRYPGIFPTTRPLVPAYHSSPPPEYGSEFECGVHRERIVNKLIAQGHSTVSGEWPWLVAVFHYTIKEGIVFQCGASLLKDRFIITAAHCLYKNSGTEEVEKYNVLVTVGARDVSVSSTADTQKLLSLSAIHKHHQYEPKTTGNDIALLVLENSVTFSDLVKPVCLWEGDEDQDVLLNAHQYGTVVGWGETGDGPSLEAPLSIQVPIVSLAECRAQDSSFRGSTNANNFCAGKLDKSGPCKGDSGSGLYIKQNNRWRLRGLVSFSLGKACGPTSYAAYTDVAKFKDWIHSKINQVL